MSSPARLQAEVQPAWMRTGEYCPVTQPHDSLAAHITRAASHQTYYTIRFLVDHERVEDAFRAYGYFRWVDDTIDADDLTPEQRIAFFERQRTLADSCYKGIPLRARTLEEQLLIDLIRSDTEPDSPLRSYIEHMLWIMDFDARRRGTYVDQATLDEYTRHLAVAVTDCMHYFIGHDDPLPPVEIRYCAVIAAHITHLLRDTFEDTAAGYFNVAREFVAAHTGDAISPQSEAYRAWVKTRVELARANFRIGRAYLARLRSFRCRLAGFAYMARFESVLDAIERDGYQLRADYPERKRLAGVAKLIASTLGRTVGLPLLAKFQRA